MTEKTAIEFLFFSYFGIDLVDNNDEKTLLETAINRAYRDAASHVLQFKFQEELKTKDKDNIVNAYKKVASHVIFERLKGMSDEKIKGDWVEELAKDLIDIYELSKEALCAREELSDCEKLSELKDFNIIDNAFTFGIAQKWINMTIKNIYLMDTIIKMYSELGNSYLSDICNVIKGDKIDIPVDDYVIKAACKLGVEVPATEKDSKNCYAGNSDKYSRRLAWSNWTPEQDEKEDVSYYRAFQKRLKDKLRESEEYGKTGCVLDKENRLWIDASIGKI